MAATQVQSASGAQNTGLATVTATWSTPATAGNTLVIIVGSDDYRTAGGIPSGFTESTGCAQQTNLGHYVWWKIAAGGETSTTYTIASASTSVWETYEYSGLDAVSPYDISAGQFIASGASSYTTSPITPSAGDRLIVAAIGGSTSAANFTGLSAWINSFAAQLVVTNTKASGTRDIIGMATRSVTADGATAYSSGATYTPNATARTGITIAFKVAAAGGASIAPAGISVPVALGSPALSDGSLSIAPTGISAPVALGAPTLADGSMTVAPAGVPVPVALGGPTLTWSATVAPDGIAVPVILGDPTVGASSVNPDGIAVPVTLGDPALSWTGSIAPDGIAVPVVLGAPIVGAVAVNPDGISVPVVLGDPALSWSATAAPDGIGVPVSLGSPTLTLSGIAPDGISVPVVLGSPVLAWSGTVRPDGISVPVSLGAPGVGDPGTPGSMALATGSGSAGGGTTSAGFTSSSTTAGSTTSGTTSPGFTSSATSGSSTTSTAGGGL